MSFSWNINPTGFFNEKYILDMHKTNQKKKKILKKMMKKWQMQVPRTRRKNTKLQVEEKKENRKVGTNNKKEAPVTINKELLRAFRFFDRNRVGHIRGVEKAIK
ncbi:unnamed protein product [Lactuca saligna]|uniref:EF-hand domain-containing protein n=1 Tax=Lactuca saligna TaxID=75948 RepID=A0AA35YXR3_LACSI|nr:unnamed protein product [Lactuca saligna]